MKLMEQMQSSEGDHAPDGSVVANTHSRGSDKEDDGEEGEDGEEAEMDADMMDMGGDDMDMDAEMEEESVEYDLDEEVEEDDEVVEEATKLSDNVGKELKHEGEDADNVDSGNAKKGPSKIVSPHGQGEPVKTHDGGDGNASEKGNPNSPKDSGGSDNLNVKPQAVNNPDEIK